MFIGTAYHLKENPQWYYAVERTSGNFFTKKTFCCSQQEYILVALKIWDS